MALCRIYLCTYQRNDLLPRALDSLLAQTFTDWVCELHNDDPRDPFPRKLVKTISDSRVSVIDHPQNLGPTRVFNLVYQEISEPFASLLEDDNWLEPIFLEMMVATMEKFPGVQVAWANMRIWRENLDGSWTDTDQRIWDRSETEPPELFHWPHPRQIRGALHSNGAMMVRTKSARRYVIPEQTPSFGMEPVRERAFPHPILLVPKTLAHFALTRKTSHSKNPAVWSQVGTLLAGSFFKHVPVREESLRQIWQESRSKKSRSTGILLFSALVVPECRFLLQFATWRDWLGFIGLFLKRPWAGFKILRSIESFPELWKFLDERTAERIQEARQRGFESL